MKKKILSLFFVCLIVSGGLLFSVNIAAAACDGKDQVTILNACISTNSVQGFIQLAVAIAQWILGVTGSVALLMFVYGGTLMILSGGESKKVQTGKDAIKAAIVGLIIVFSSFLIIRFVVTSLGGEFKTKEGVEIKVK